LVWVKGTMNMTFCWEKAAKLLRLDYPVWHEYWICLSALP
jgi:hypothetical protein